MTPRLHKAQYWARHYYRGPLAYSALRVAFLQRQYRRERGR